MNMWKKKIFIWAALAVLSTFIGAVVGLIDFVFGKGLLWITQFREQEYLYLIPFLGLSGLLIVFLFNQFGRSVKGGMALVFEVGLGEKKRISPVLVPLMIITTWLTHLFGGSAGREGVAVQLGASVSNWIDRKTDFITIPNKTRIFVVTGMAAGFSGLFQTPIAAAFFAMEVLIIGQIEYSALFPVACSVLTADLVTRQLGLEKFSYLLTDIPDFDAWTIIKVILSGLLFGLVGACFSRFLRRMKSMMQRIWHNPYQRILLGGMIISFCLLLLGHGRYAGLGTNLIKESFELQPIIFYDWILKLLFTVFTLAVGFQGGEVTPLFAIGATLGVCTAGMFGLPIELCAALGYICVFGSATNTLLAPMFIGAEVFGFQGMPYYVLAVVFAYLVNGNQSIYALQRDISG